MTMKNIFQKAINILSKIKLYEFIFSKRFWNILVGLILVSLLGAALVTSWTYLPTSERVPSKRRYPDEPKPPPAVSISTKELKKELSEWQKAEELKKESEKRQKEEQLKNDITVQNSTADDTLLSVAQVKQLPPLNLDSLKLVQQKRDEENYKLVLDSLKTMFPRDYWTGISSINRKLEVYFTKFDTEKDFDILYIYDGTKVSNSALIGEYSGKLSPWSVRSSDHSGALTFKFTSDDENSASGWVAAVYAKPKSNSRQAAIVMNSTPHTVNNADFYDPGGPQLNYPRNCSYVQTLKPINSIVQEPSLLRKLYGTLDLDTFSDKAQLLQSYISILSLVQITERVNLFEMTQKLTTGSLKNSVSNLRIFSDVIAEKLADDIANLEKFVEIILTSRNSAQIFEYFYSIKRSFPSPFQIDAFEVYYNYYVKVGNLSNVQFRIDEFLSFIQEIDKNDLVVALKVYLDLFDKKEYERGVLEQTRKSEYRSRLIAIDTEHEAASNKALARADSIRVKKEELKTPSLNFFLGSLGGMIFLIFLLLLFSIQLTLRSIKEKM